MIWIEQRAQVKNRFAQVYQISWKKFLDRTMCSNYKKICAILPNYSEEILNYNQIICHMAVANIQKMITLTNHTNQYLHCLKMIGQSMFEDKVC